MLVYTVTLLLNQMGQELLMTDKKEIKIELDCPITNIAELEARIDQKCPRVLYDKYWYSMSPKINVGELVVITVGDDQHGTMDFTCPVVEIDDENETFTIELDLDTQNNIIQNFPKSIHEWYIYNDKMKFKQDEEFNNVYVQITKKKNKVKARLAYRYEIDNYKEVHKQQLLIKEIGSIISKYFSNGFYEIAGTHTTKQLTEFRDHLKRFLEWPELDN